MQTTGVVDAYMHAGQPRFGSAGEASMVCDHDYAAFCGGNAERLFFPTPAPPAASPELPDWLCLFPITRPVTVAPAGPFSLPMDVYEPLLSDYLTHNHPDAPLSFEGYLVRQLRICARALLEEA